MSKNKARLAKRVAWSFVIFLILLVACGKKKVTEPTYEHSLPPEIELPDDEDLDDLPEAGEENEDN
tara:strand:- start:1601 stop:1798 length:198 start_codon:yes stop_codon:yes gene_type:complete